MIDYRDYIVRLMSRSTDAKTCDEALKFSQAALNLAHAQARYNEDRLHNLAAEGITIK